MNKNYFCIYFMDCGKESFFDKDGNQFFDPRDEHVPHFTSQEEAKRWYEEHKGTIGYPIVGREILCCNITEPELPKVGEKFKFGCSEYTAVATFTDKEKQYVVGRKEKITGVVEYSHIFCLDSHNNLFKHI